MCAGSDSFFGPTRVNLRTGPNGSMLKKGVPATYNFKKNGVLERDRNVETYETCNQKQVIVSHKIRTFGV